MMSRTAAPRIAVLGAGPVGLEAALYAASLQYPVTVYERGRVGEHLWQWGHVRLFSPFGMNTTGLGRAHLHNTNREKLPAETELLTGKQHLATYLEPLAALPLLQGMIRNGVEVLEVGRLGLLKDEGPDSKRSGQPFRLLLRDSQGKEFVDEADLVLDCTGTYGNSRHLGDGGIAAIGEAGAKGHISWGVEDILGARKDHFADRTTLVVGSGFSAATSVYLLAELAKKHPATWIIWLSRKPGTQPIRRIMNDPLRERDLLAGKANMLATRGEGHVEFYQQSVVERIELQGKDGIFVEALVAGQPRSWQVDRIIANVGYQPDSRIYRELQVQECPSTHGPMNLSASLAKHAGNDCLGIPPQGPAALRNPEPGFYILGMKSFGRRSNFLLRTGFDQVREVFTLISGKADLDLYRKAKS